LEREAADGTSNTASPVELVNVLAGTSSTAEFSKGNVLPIISRPWGFNHWAVQSRDDGSWFFHPEDHSFQGIRCTHQPSPWLGDYTHFLISPSLEGDRLSSYDPTQSKFAPYAFEADIGDNDKVHLKMTPTMHGAMVQVSLPPGKNGAINIDLPDNGWEVLEGGKQISGKTLSRSDTPEGKYPDNFGMSIVAEGTNGSTWAVQGQTATLNFPASDEGKTWSLQLATSFIDSDHAKFSLQREVSGVPFEKLLQEGQTEWNELLSRVQVEYNEKDRAKVFYSNLYRGMLFPRFFWEYERADDADDQHLRMVHYSVHNGQVLPGRAVTDQGFWDAYRTTYPMLSIIFPDKLGEIIDGWVNSYKELGWLPTWPSPSQRKSMTGTMGDCSLADAVVKSSQGLMKGFDRKEAFQAIMKDAMTIPDQDAESFFLGRVALHDYATKGFIPDDDWDAEQFAGNQQVALSLNYNLADACVALAAEAMGHKSEAAELRKRSKGYVKLFDKKLQYFRKRSARGWDGELDPISWGDGFTEASASQYRFYVPHDVKGLAKLYGGTDHLCQRIEETLQPHDPSYEPGSYGGTIHEMAEGDALNPQTGLYGHNNQPSHHILWVAASAGCSDLAQKYLRRVTAQFYTIDGWTGDEDNGEMSSWYVLSALGIYSLLPGSDELILGSPEVLKATITVPERPTLTVLADGNSEESVYVRKVDWRDSVVSGHSVRYTDLAKGGVLRFDMSDTPSGH
jgi:predicted alpha-1,2-mannosidase